MKIKVTEVIGTANAVYHSAGLKLFNALELQLKNKHLFDLSFEGIESCSSMFLNASIGKLYLEMPREVIEKYMQLTNYQSLHKFSEKLEEVIGNAIQSDLHDKLLERA